ncbi:sushi, von Willebrand factor type A, EGF and pentraxin domain-containing protein 1-like [Mya arenaria]|uniref:sushi, von Willebrand factor type A, EGF and pentraxin domain-containing protein 1-like n=1 Tax=Mya arenaria TaxID=6604 RepID=UPI0022E55E36|nr:sushi, von Willebrand factor type A, EGF and pentraxin domain-containing protein 1-like [Mya arenaria]
MGYYISGSANITCQASGEWNSSTPLCTKYNCGNLEIPADGSIYNSSGTEYGATAYFSCRDGYYLTGSPNATCNATGQWDNPEPNCTIYDCFSLNNITSGYVDTPDGTTFGETATYACFPGYDLIGNATTQCLHGGEWSSKPPICVVKDCGNVTLPVNGFVDDTNGTTFGEIVKYSCATGYDLAGDASRICEADGTWNSSDPKCEIHDCGNPGSVDNGNVHVKNGSTYQSSALYTCRNGYMISGDNAYRMCTPTGWEDPAPECVKEACPSPPITMNGTIILLDNSTLVGSKYKVACDPGLIPKPGGPRTCKTSLEWTGRNITCEIPECIPPIQYGANITVNGSRPGDFAFYECLPDFNMSTTDAYRTCLITELWSDPEPLCLGRDCGEVETITNGSVLTPNGTRHPYSIYYVCDEGFNSVGDSIRTCQVNGSWDNLKPNCSIVDCGPPPTPVNGSIAELLGTSYGNNIPNGNVSTPSGTAFGQNASYTCNEGYKLTGGSTITCNATGQWNGPVPKCTIYDCGERNLTNGIVNTSTGTQYEATAYFSCNDGYYLMGSPDATCNATGQWDNPLPNCTIYDCGEPYLTDGVVNTSSGTQYEATAYFSCNDGYYLMGSPDATCNATGQWDNPLPNCTIYDCGEPYLTDGVVNTSNGTQYEATAYFSCNDGYLLTGSPDATCNATGQWDNPLHTTCSLVDCFTPDEISNGNVFTSSMTTFGHNATYTCSEGYNLTGAHIRTCQGNGSWSFDTPSCLLVECGDLLPPTNGNIAVSTGTTFGQQAVYSCQHGYDLNGANTRTCTANGTWSGSPPGCIGIVANID